MRVIISGGGGASKNPAAYELFAGSVDKSKPVLYIGLAIRPENVYDSYSKFVLSMAKLGILCTRCCADTGSFDEFDLDSFGGIYCAGGNTFRLLKLLKECGADKKIVDYVRKGGAYIGSSAGAIICGEDIYPIIYMDPNSVVLEDTKGFDLMKGYSTVAHYGDAVTESRNAEEAEAVRVLAEKYPRLIALSEECAIVVEDDRIYTLGAPCIIYNNGIPVTVEEGTEI